MKVREPWDDEECKQRRRRLTRINNLADLECVGQSDTNAEDLLELAKALLPVAEWLAQWPDADLAFQCDPYHLEAAEQLDTVAKALGVWPKGKEC